MAIGTSTIVQKQFRETGTVPPTCRIDSITHSSDHTVNSTATDTRSPKLKGNRITAMPYSRTVIEPVSLSGMLDFSYAAGTPPPVCAREGAKSAGTATGKISPAAFQLIPPQPVLVVDADIKAFNASVAETKAVSNARKSFMNVPLLLAERRETIMMAQKRLVQLTRSVKGAQTESLEKWMKSRKAQKSLVAKDAASWHLELLFGWLPLIDEIDGLLDILCQTDSVDFYGRGKHAQVTEQRSAPQLRQPYRTIGRYTSVIPYRRVDESIVKQSCRVSLRYRITVGGFKRARELGFNPVSTTFDLVPLSFVLNFISNAGRFLSTFDPLIGAQFVTGSRSDFVEVDQRILLQGTTIQQENQSWKTLGTAAVTRRGMLLNRTVYEHEPLGTFVFQNNLTLAKLATSASLVVQRAVKPVRMILKLKQFRYKGPRPQYLPPSVIGVA